MNIETKIDKRLWQTISTNYLRKNYTGAILDSIHFLGDLIREKANLESDGVALIGEAFGGNSPKIKVNKLQTESEKNVQKGLEQTLRGIYQMIRNPRSHTKYEDLQKDADSIIIFIDFVIGIIDQSKSTFTIEQVVKRVLDEDFLATDKYAQLIIQEIPEKRRLETLVYIFNLERYNQSIEKLSVFIKKLYNSFKKTEQEEILQIISEELKYTNNFEFIKLIVCSFNNDWKKIDEAAILRIENKFIKAIKTAAYYYDEYEDGYYKDEYWELSLYLNYIITDFTLRDELFDSLVDKIISNHPEDFVVRFCIPLLKYFENQFPNFILEVHLSGKLKSGKIPLINAIESLPESIKKHLKANDEPVADDDFPLADDDSPF